MRSEKFHRKGEKPEALVVDEASRLTVQSANEITSIYQLDDNQKKVKLLGTVMPGQMQKFKLHDIEEVLLESKGDFTSIIEGADKLDTTPLEVPVERPLTQTQQLRQWLQNEENMRNYARQELTWEEFKDLGNLDDGDEFYSQFNQSMTRYEMQAEALRQETNPLRGNPVSEKLDEIDANRNNINKGGNSENATIASTTADSTTVSQSKSG